ncbi:hypothetical protein BAE44_0022611 [Dichanthelium oligosanthes]|uniref:Uncharacterized protein n=1 Tax=Dichanthelium oligosanthes TaxID=888268 RepID=A0A1E5UU42_9POAL|nr:hypothetical protein BAE44_0022611 [Dichanthelium oligosanthes]
MAAGGHLRPGSYLGDVSALSFLPSSPRPLLLAGTGSELLVYETGAARLIAAFQVFDGVRVHGIEPRGGGPSCSNYSLAVFGERRVKLFSLGFVVGADEGEVGEVRLELEQRLPGFDHWVLDARFLEVDGLLAIGLGDNSAALWDFSKRMLVTRVKSPEKCLLYSMRMWGDSVRQLLVASGTILNEVTFPGSHLLELALNANLLSQILIWKLAPQILDTSNVSNCENINLGNKQYMAVQLGRLKEHEGSIFRIAWNSDGSKFISVSDDRSARVWMLSFKSQSLVNQTASQDNVEIIPKLTLFGHSARIWDCYVSDSIVITGGEDCTCCIWGMDGKLIKIFKEHISVSSKEKIIHCATLIYSGRGIWRCLFDPSSLLLVTAGFDSAIKVHHLFNFSLHDKMEDRVVSNGQNYDSEIFVVSSPSILGQYGPLDSKSEYVRCLHFAEENVLYVATNNGYLHHAKLSTIGDVRWTEIIQVTEKAPIICMDVMPSYSNLSLNREDIIALGDGRGNVTVVRLSSGSIGPKVNLSFTWSAEKDRQLLGVYWCKSLECRSVNSDPRGVLKLWNIRDALFPSIDVIHAPHKFPLVAVFESSFGARIMCLDASPREEILIAGDKKGNITAFPFPKILVMYDSGVMQKKMPPCDRFKGAHGISSVTSVHIKDSTADHIEIHTTGGDGCICFFKYGRNVRKIEFFGMKLVKELGTIQSIYTNLAPEGQLSSSYAIGFTSADFIIWDLENERKMAQVSCGGWRRPYSYYLGTVPEYQNCFAFVKDHDIHIHRHWAPTQDKKLLPHVLHLQFHGREVHSLCFIDPASYSDLENSSDLLIATGCEDGTVRLTGFLAGSSGRWCSSKLLGEHVGGSAVRATCFIPKTYTIADKSCNYSSNSISDDIAVENKDETFLLISVGSKQVLTAWILQPRIAENGQVCLNGLDTDSKQSSKNLESGDFAMSFQWLTTHMPPKLTRNRLKPGHIKQSVEEGNSYVVQPNLGVMDHMENDWRYLSVTAFLLKHPVLRLTVCFVVVACSDATVVLRALLLPSRLWFDVALLVPQASPVLVLRHIIINAKDDAGDRYLIVSGSTDGSITFWNLTETIRGFMQLISETQPHMSIDCQRRPRTGRGSQGGRRRWRSLANSSVKKRDGDIPPPDGSNLSTPDAAENPSETNDVENTQNIVHEASDGINTEMPSSTQSGDITELRPVHLLSSVHQSGVNCLHISYSIPDKSYCIISGGDDQAVQCFSFRIGSLKDCSTTTVCLNSHDNDMLNILHQHKAASAHSAAVKGIWTDGTWAFSTGLDQRVRCWKMGPSGKFTEYSHAIISVPEPETLDVFHDRAKRKYQIAVAGRGMQMVEFSPPEDN